MGRKFSEPYPIPIESILTPAPTPRLSSASDSKYNACRFFSGGGEGEWGTEGIFLGDVRGACRLFS
jgi:hypothetical protein